ncbi:MAG: hypothetical protein ACLPTF_13240 [Steroidobacteraceae bacterium]
MFQMPAKGLVAFAICCFGLIGAAQATDLLPAETRVVAASSAPAPSQLSFTIATAEDLVVTLTDLQLPAALASASIAITQNDGLVGSATLATPASTATISLPGATGNYTMYVFGTPGASFSVGTFTACVAPKANPSNCIQSASFSGNITAQSAAQDPTVSTLSMSLTVATAGAYTFNFADLTFPVALNTAPNLALFQGSTTIQLGITSGSSISLSPGTYTLLAIAQADQTVKSGLYGITIAGPVGVAPLLNSAIPVGLMTSNPTFVNPTTQTVTLTVTDYAFPGALTSASALITNGATAVGMASVAGGAGSFTAPAGTLAAWTYANPGTTAGTYSVDLAGGTDLFSTAQGVEPTGSTTYAYAFETQVLPAGTYQATAADLQFPSQLTGIAFAVAQNGVILQQSTSAATLSFTASAAPVVLLVSAQTPASGSASGNGLFDVNVQSGGASAQLVFDKTQDVSSSSALFDAQTVTLTTSGSFDATLTDLKFPTQFDTLALVVSRGTQILGKVYGGGTFTFAGTPGSYQLTFVATPSAKQEFGLYGVKVLASQPPTVMLTSNVATAAVGTAIQLSWTTTNTASCTASGGSWTGSKAATGSGTESVALAATTTYTLTCTSASGATAAQSVTVTATSSHSGGGALDLSLLGLCGILLAARVITQKGD